MSVGVGRGRGRLPQQVNGDMEPLRRPNIATVGRGRNSSLTQSNLSQPLGKSKLVDIELALSDPKVDCMTLFRAIDDYLQANPSDEDLQVFVKKVIEKTLISKTNNDCICKCIYLASKHKVKGEALHMTFFTFLEQKFNGLEGIKSSYGAMGVWRFHLFFSSVCQYIRNQRQAPFVDLIEGLKKLSLEAVQPNTAEETKIAAASIARCIYYMKMINRPNSQIDLLMSKLRGLLHASSVAATSDPDVLLWLTLGLETSCLAGTKLPDETIQYYCQMLGPEAAIFNLVMQPALNLPKHVQSNYNFADISYTLNFI